MPPNREVESLAETQPSGSSGSGVRGLRLLVTGGAGFIGSRLCDLLVRQGHRVVCLDNFCSSSPQSVEHLRQSERFEMMDADVSEPVQVRGPVDGVLHLATSADPRLFRERPVQIARTAAIGTAVMLELARAHRCRFLLASSDAVYGDPLEQPQRESSLGVLDPVGPRSAYDEAKRFAETLTMAYHAQNGVETAIARIFHSYGEGMPADGRLIPTYIANALQGEPLLVMGSGEQTRAYCHVSDIVDGIVALFRCGYNGPVNLGSPREISVLSLARLIIDLAGSQSSIRFGPALEGDRRARCPDISLAGRVLGWQPRIPLEEGLRRAIEFASAGAAVWGGANA